MGSVKQSTQGMNMCNLNMGRDQISIRDAVRRVEQNIAALQMKLTDAGHVDHFSEKIERFYEQKIAIQKATLEWLERVL
jgi:hypothetical protein